jgi:hypothetical protein
MTGPAARASHRRRYGLPLPHMLLADPTEPSWDPGGGFVLRRLSGLPVIPGPPQKPASVDRTSAPNAPIWTVLATDLRSAKGVQNGGYLRAVPGGRRGSAERVHALSRGASASIVVVVSSSRKPPDWCCHSLA